MYSLRCEGEQQPHCWFVQKLSVVLGRLCSPLRSVCSGKKDLFLLIKIPSPRQHSMTFFVFISIFTWVSLEVTDLLSVI